MSYYILDRIVQAKVTEDSLSVDLEDGRTISVPPGWFPRLVHGTPAERVNSEIAGQGLVSIGFHRDRADRAGEGSQESVQIVRRVHE